MVLVILLAVAIASGYWAVYYDLSEFGLHKYSSLALGGGIVVHLFLHYRRFRRKNLPPKPAAPVSVKVVGAALVVEPVAVIPPLPPQLAPSVPARLSIVAREGVTSEDLAYVDTILGWFARMGDEAILEITMPSISVSAEGATKGASEIAHT